jgi:ElaB/YqjD/DUF883 family membrane-anchored ribosome-binding protein
MNAPVEKLAADAKVLAADIEELVRATAAQSGERLASARSRIQSALASAKETVGVQGRTAVDTTDRYVKENAWTAVGVAAGIGLLVGILIGRR